MGVRPCVSIFWHYYALVGFGRSRGIIGAYYFQLRHRVSSSYISAFSSAKWKDWRTDWVVAMTDANDRLELPTREPLLDRNSGKAKLKLPMELNPVLDWVKYLAAGSLTSMMILGDFLRCRIAPLQQRSRIACLYTRVNNCSRIERGVGTNLSNAEPEVLIRAMTGEVYTPESLVLLDKTKDLCEDQGLRIVVVATLLTLDDGGLAVRQLGGDPNCGVQIPDIAPDIAHRTEPSPSRPGDRTPASSSNGKEAEAGSSQSSRDRDGDRTWRL